MSLENKYICVLYNVNTTQWVPNIRARMALLTPAEESSKAELCDSVVCFIGLFFKTGKDRVSLLLQELYFILFFSISEVGHITYSPIMS